MSYFTPMKAGRIKPMCDRTGRQSSEYQYVRELWKNTLESGGNKARIHPEWGAVERLGVYRFCYADNGGGMSPTELVNFLNQFGGGGKAIGGEHENYGIGAKSSTLPGNHAGVIVASRKHGETSAILLRHDPTAEEYGLERWAAVDADDDLYFVEAIDLDEQDLDLEICSGTTVSDLLDTFIDPDHGTVTVLCGMTGHEHTYFSTGEGADFNIAGPVTGIGTYLNQRFWDPRGDIQVLELRNADKSSWPQSRDDAESNHINAVGSAGSWKVKNRNTTGLRKFLEVGAGKQKPIAQGSLPLSDGTQAHWYLLPESANYSSKVSSGGTYWGGGVATLYDGEVYDIHSAGRLRRLRDFGVTRETVAKRVTIVLEPPMNNGREGVYPTDSRSQLLWTGGKRLPWSRWGDEFYRNMPQEIETELAKANERFADDESDEEPIEDDRVEGFVERAKRFLYLVHDGQSGTARAIRKKVIKVGTASHKGRSRGTGPGGGGGGSRKKYGSLVLDPDGDIDVYGESEEGVDTTVVAVPQPGEMPKIQWVDKSQFDLAGGPVAAAFDINRYQIDANVDYALFREIVEHYRIQRPVLSEDDIMREIKRVYGLRLRTYVAHTKMQEKAGILSSDTLEQRLNDMTLTAVCDGILIEDVSINQNLGAVEGKKKKASRKRASR